MTQELADMATVEYAGKLEGRNLSMILSPKH
jgi:translation initiation factor IF-3